MDIVKLAIKCCECFSFLEKPVTLPCGSSVCFKHLENLDDETFFCKPCEDDHHIEKSKINVNKGLEILINANLQNLNLGSDYKAAFNLCKEYDEAIKDIESLTNDPNVFIKDMIDDFKNKTELIREDFKLKIDEKANQIIEQLDKYKTELENNLDSADIKTSISKLTETMVQAKVNLAAWEKTLGDFGCDENEWTKLKQKSYESKLQLNKEIRNFLRELLQDKVQDCYSCVNNFEQIKLTSDSKFYQEIKEYEDFLKMFDLDVMNSKVIDEAQKQQLLTLCNISVDKIWKLIYQGSEHGLTPKDFHAMCDNIPNTLTIIKSTCGSIFGGYTSQSWDQSGVYKYDASAYLFSLVNPQNQPQKLIIQNASNAIYCHSDYGPTFGNGTDLLISYSSNLSNLGSAYPNRNGNQPYLTESQSLTISDIDIYQIV